MQEGESELGGLKIPHGNTTPPTPTPGPQPVGFETLQNTQNTPPATPTISATPATQSSPQSFIPNNTTEKETSSTDLASQTPTPQSTQPVQPLQPSARSPQSTSQAPFSPQPFPTQPSQPFIAQPTPAAASDILLSPTPTKKSKKWPVITIIVIIIVSIIGLIIWLFTNPNSSFQLGAQDAQVKELYNQYTNYILFGEDTANDVEEFDPTDTFFIDENYENEEFLINAQDLFQEFYEKFIDSNLTETTVVPVQSTKEHFEFLVQRLNVVPIDEELFQVYIESGKEAAIEYINNFYDLSDDENYLTELLKNLNKEYTLAELSEWEIYDNAGCRVDAQYDPACIAEIPYDALTGPATQLGDLESSIDNLTTSSINWIKDQCLEINLSLKGIISNIEEEYVEDEENNGEIDEE